MDPSAAQAATGGEGRSSPRLSVEKFFPQLSCPLKRSPCVIKTAAVHTIHGRAAVYPLTCLHNSCARVKIGSTSETAKPLVGDQRPPQNQLQFELLLGPRQRLRGVWHGLEQLQPPGAVGDRLRIGVPPEGSCGCLLQIRHCPCGVSPTIKVDRQLCCLFDGACAIAICLPLAKLAMKSDALPDRQPVVQTC